MLLIEPISAITSWEDYEYQGHVALYVALKSILDLLQNGKSISGYDLQLRVKKNFVNQLNNLDKMSPTLYLSIEDIVYEGMTLLWVYVPPTSTVEKCANRIYDSTATKENTSACTRKTFSRFCFSNISK